MVGKRSRGPDPQTLRHASTTLVALGGFLAYAGVSIHRLEPEPLPPAALILTLYGIVAFLTGLRGLTDGAVARPLRRLLIPVATRLNVTPAQTLLLLHAPMLSVLAWLAAGDKPTMRLPGLAIGAWILALACLLLGGLLGRPRLTQAHLKPSEVALVAALALFASLTRVWRLDSIPWLLAGDEASAGLSAVDLLQGEWNNVFSVAWFSFPALYFTIPAVSIWAFGQTIFGLRLPSAIAGILTVIATYLYARTTFGKRTALLAAAYLAAFHFHIHFSRIGLNNVWDGIFFALVGAALWRAWTTNRRQSYVAAGLALGLGLYFYTTTRSLVVMTAAWWGIALLTKRGEFRKRWHHLMLTVLAAAVVVFPLGLFYAVHPDHFAAPMRRVAVLGPWLENEVRNTGQPAWRILLEQFKISALAFTSVPLRHWYVIDHPMLFPLGATLFLLGVLLSLLRIKDLRHLWLLLWLGAAITIGALSESTPAAQRYVLVAPCVALLVALLLEEFTARFLIHFPQRHSLVYAGLGTLLLAMIWTDLRFYFGEYTPSHRFGDRNTEVAQRLAAYLQDHPAGHPVYFSGFPRMGFRSIPTLPYLAPHVEGIDLDENAVSAILQEPPPAATFVFLPETMDSLEQFRRALPGGTLHRIYGNGGDLLFLVYEYGIP